MNIPQELELKRTPWREVRGPIAMIAGVLWVMWPSWGENSGISVNLLEGFLVGIAVATVWLWEKIVYISERFIKSK